MKEAVYKKVKKYIDAQDMIAAGDFVAAGVSGGADSVCLLHMLWRLREKRPFLLAAVHVNHGLRKEAGEDAAFVRKLCEEWEIPFFLREADVSGYAAQNRVSTEEAGRLLRYQAFEEILAKLEIGGMKCVKAAEKAGEQEDVETGRRTTSERKEACGRYRIAVAHNAQDRAETMLFHLFRGSGLRGLTAIRPVREAVIRPLLQLNREEIETYLTAQGLSWREDSTNGEDEYTRNRIRHHILSYAEREICSGAAAHMGELADILAETEAYLSRETERFYASCAVGQQDEETVSPAAGGQEAVLLQAGGGQAAGGVHGPALRLDKLKSLDPVMQKRVLLYTLERVIPCRKDITARHVEGLLALMEKGGSGSLSLPCGIRAYKEYDILTVKREEKISTVPRGTFICILWDREAIPAGSLFYKKEQDIPENRYTKWFDYDKITTALVIRCRKEGDYLTIDDALHTQSLARYLINEKIPKEKRDHLCVLADESHVLWVPGYRTSSGFRVEKDTKRVLEVHYGE